MSVIAVDLAAKFSAACWMSDLYIPLYQWDSWQKPQAQFITTVTDPWSSFEQPPPVLVVEDLPPRVPWMTTVKDVCRLQGRFIDRMDSFDHLDALLFVQPDVWRSHFPGLERGTGPDAVVPVAARFGYTAPDLTERVGKGDRATARKVATDYCAAYLIGRWAIDQFATHGTFDAPRTTRCLTEVSRG